MKAIRTTDTREWVKYTFGRGYHVTTLPSLYDELTERQMETVYRETGHPCKWVDVEVVVKDDSAKPITENEMHLNMQYYMEYCQMKGYVTPMEWIEKHKHF